MPTLKADFVADWVAYLRQDLITVQGWPATEIAALNDSDVPMRYFDAQRRRVAVAPRIVRLADDFVCPTEQVEGWAALIEKVANGEDVNPHRSTRHSKLSISDGLLAEWGVHHLHLGTTRHPRYTNFVNRTGPLVFALVTDQEFCAINVYSHRDFEDSAVLESVHRNWPELVSRYRAKGVTGGVWTAEQRRALRSKHVNVLTRTKDGTVYMTVGIATSGAGVSFEAIKQADYFQDQVRVFQESFEKSGLAHLLTLLKQKGLGCDREIEAKLRLSPDSVQVFFPKYNVLMDVNFTQKLLPVQ